MKCLLIFAALVVATQAAGKWNQGLSVRFGIGLGAGRDFFIPLPQTLREAKNSRWVQTTRLANQPRSKLVLYTPSIDDVVVGGFYDANGDIAGLQVALPKDSFTDNPYSWAGQGFSEWTAPPNSKGVRRTYWVTAIFFVSEKTGRVLQADHVYVTGYNKQLLPISIVASDVADTAKSRFTRQACIPFMGRHYYYEMTPQTKCSTETILPWFTLLDQSAGSNQLIGLGLMVFGKLPASALVRDYFERPTTNDVKTIVNNGPQCLYDTTTKYGVVTMHIYFIDSPLLINCLNTF